MSIDNVLHNDNDSNNDDDDDDDDNVQHIYDQFKLI